LRGEEGNKSFGFGLIDKTEREVIFGDWKRGTSEAMYELTITFHVAFEELGF
jgi:hypothetical protein